MRNRLTRVVALSTALLAVVAVGGTALAGHLAGDVDSYTGCLTTKGGTLTLIAAGNAPQKPCPGGSIVAHLSGGDITKVSVTGALTGGGDNGEVTIGLKPEFSLPSGCGSGNVAKWNSSLEQWECKLDNDTLYFASTGLDVTASGIFSIEPAYRLKNTPDCGSGQFATGFDSSGEIQCAAPAAAVAASVFGSTQSEPGFSNGVGIPDDGDWRTYASASLPAGSFIVMGKGTLDRDGVNDAGGTFEDEDAQKARCRLFAGSQLDMTSIDVKEDTESFDAFPFSLVAPLTLASGATVELQCKATEADAVGIREARFLALKIG